MKNQAAERHFHWEKKKKKWNLRSLSYEAEMKRFAKGLDEYSEMAGKQGWKQPGTQQWNHQVKEGTRGDFVAMSLNI